MNLFGKADQSGLWFAIGGRKQEHLVKPIGGQCGAIGAVFKRRDHGWQNIGGRVFGVDGVERVFRGVVFRALSHPRADQFHIFCK